jgi:hypothetical protein
MFVEATVHKSGNQLHVTHGDDKECYVEFRLEAVHMVGDSEKEGRPIFKDFPFIRIMFPGDKTKVVDRPVTDADKQRFPQQYAAFERQGEQVQSGTPITEWPFLTKSQALEMKGIGIHTVEQLAGVADHNLTWFGAREYREKAKAWLEAAKGDSAIVSQLTAQIEALKADIEAMREAPKRRGKHADAE